MDAKSVSNGVKASHGFGLRTAPPVPSATKPAAAAARGNHKNGGSSSDMDIASDSDEETFERHHSPQDYKTHVRFPHVAAAHNGGLGRNERNNNMSSHNECETRRNVEAGTTGRTQNGTITSTTSLLPRFPTFHARLTNLTCIALL